MKRNRNVAVSSSLVARPVAQLNTLGSVLRKLSSEAVVVRSPFRSPTKQKNKSWQPN